MEDLKIKFKGKEYEVKVEEVNGKIKVYCGDDVYEVDAKSDIDTLFADSAKEKDIKEDQKVVKAPLPGTIFAVNVKAGDKIKKGASLIKMMAMKMENDIAAVKDCVIKEVKVKKDDNVNRGDILIVIE